MKQDNDLTRRLASSQEDPPPTKYAIPPPVRYSLYAERTPSNPIAFMEPYNKTFAYRMTGNEGGFFLEVIDTQEALPRITSLAQHLKIAVSGAVLLTVEPLALRIDI